MILNFPATADTFNLPLTVAERNLLNMDTPASMGDVLYSLMAIEQYILANTEAFAADSVTTKRGSTYFDVATIQGDVFLGVNIATGCVYTIIEPFTSPTEYLALVTGWLANGSGDAFTPAVIILANDRVTVYPPEDNCRIQILVIPKPSQ